MNLPLHSDKGVSSYYRRYAALFILNLLICCPAIADTTNSFFFNIYEKNLSAALTQLATQADIQILFDPRLTDPINTDQVTIKGWHTVADALAQLVSTTTLEYLVNDKIIIVRLRKNKLDIAASEKEIAPQPEKPPIPYEVVVTGTPGGSSQTKQALSFAVTSANAQKIAQRAPHNTADLFKSIPGIWVESSGGVAGSNIDVRGLPGGGDAPFVTLSLNGMPVYPAATLSFMDNLALFRLDETIERLEGLRGGPSTIYSNGQPGLTANFLLKEGHDEVDGGFKYTTSNYNLNRVDLWVSGPLSESLYYMLGGYSSTSPGVRDTGFDSEQGYQFTGELTWRNEPTTITIFRRITNDYGTWYVPNSAALGASYSQLGPGNRMVSILQQQLNTHGRDLVDNHDTEGDGIPEAEIISKSYNLGKGRGWDGYIQGLSADIALSDNWVAIERLSITQGNADTYSLLSDGAAVALGTLNGGKDGTTISGKAVSVDAMVQRFGPWVIQKQIESTINELTLNKTWNNNKFTIGHYFTNWDVTDSWAMGKQKYYEQKHDGELISPLSISDPCQAYQVITCDWSYDLQARGDATESAFYTAAKATFGLLTLDAGFRQTHYETSYNFNDNSEANNRHQLDERDLQSYTAAASWEIDEAQGIFFRLNSGFSLPKFDDYRTHAQAPQDQSNLTTYIKQRELGYKIFHNNYSLFATAFYNQVQLPPECTTASCQSPETQALGLELESNVTLDAFAVDLLATVQSATIVKGMNKGNQVLRQPNYQLSLSPSYRLNNESNLAITVYGDINIIGARYSNNDNQLRLAAFNKINIGTQVNIDKTTVRLSIDNLTNQEGVDEGTRLNTSQTNVRYILPRNLRFSISYDF